MKRKILAVMLATGMAMSLGACGSSESGAESNDTAKEEKTDASESTSDTKDETKQFEGVKIEVEQK